MKTLLTILVIAIGYKIYRAWYLNALAEQQKQMEQLDKELDEFNAKYQEAQKTIHSGIFPYENFEINNSEENK